MVRSLLLVLGVGHVIFMTLIYSISIAQDYLDSEKYFPSNAFRRDPTRAIASIALPLNAGISAFVIGLHLRRIYPLVEGRAIIQWRTIAVLEAISFITLLGLAAASMESYPSIHWAFGTLFFLSTVFLLVLFTSLEQRVSLVRPRWLRGVRFSISVALLADTVFMLASVNYDVLFSAGEIFMIQLFVLHTLSYYHGSDYPMRAYRNIHAFS